MAQVWASIVHNLPAIRRHIRTRRKFRRFIFRLFA